MTTGLVGFAHRGLGAALVGLLWLGLTTPLAAQTGGRL